METMEFAGLSDNEASFDAAREKNRTQALRKSAFHAQFSALKREGEVDLEALRTFAFEEHRLDYFQTAELVEIFTAFHNQQSFSDMIRMVRDSTDEDFKAAQIVREFYLVACHQTGQFNQAIEIGQTWVTEGYVNGGIYGSLGKAWLKKHDIAETCAAALKEPDATAGQAAARDAYVKYFDDPDFKHVDDNAQSCLYRAKEHYEAGFLISFEYYPGVNAAYCLMKLGEVEQARNMARIVNMACLRDGGRETTEYWCATSMMESACIMGADKDEIQSLSAMFLKLESKKWQLEATLRMLERIKKTLLRDETDATSVDAALSSIGNILKHHGQVEFNRAASLPEKKTALSSFLKSSFNYRGLAATFAGANFITGNIKLGGQLPDHCLTRSDWQQFENLLKTKLEKLIGAEEAQGYPPTLREIKKPEEFLDVADVIIRKSFGTDERMLEDLYSAGHAEYDETVTALLKLAGADEGTAIDSRTNISVVMGLGLGDCRHHAQVKQILFDAWQKAHINEALGNVYGALKNSDLQGYLNGIKEFSRIEAVELRTMDVIIKAPIQMADVCVKLHDEQGRPVFDESSAMNAVEEHTLTFLVRHDEYRKNIQRIDFADSFYQNNYRWGEGEISLDHLTLDGEGRLIIPAKTIDAVNPDTGELVSVPVQLMPTAYTGKRDMVANDEYGKLLLLGIPVSKDFDLVDKITQPASRRAAALKALHRWHMETVKNASRKKFPRLFFGHKRGSGGP